MSAVPAWLDAHLAVLPVLLPLLTAVALLALGDGLDRPDRPADAPLRRARRLSLASVLLSLAVSALLVADAAGGGWRVYRLGEWPAPFGIVLVVDRLSALMVLLVQAVALPVVLQAGVRWDARGRHFHALLQFLLMGLNGAFITGDLFNLFVFFEVLLIASYVLLAHGQGRERFRAALPYVVLNLAASALFLLGAALVLAAAGTLNLADLALRVPALGPDHAPLARAGGMLLLVVFGFKAALMPLHLWLPAAYAAASAPVAAMFALMTKVGVYAIVRIHGVVFGNAGDAGGAAASLVEPWLLPLALAGSLLGALGALAAGTLPRLVGWLTITSVGTLLAAIGLFSAPAWSAGLYYTVHSTLVVAALFLLIELLADQRGPRGDRLVAGGALAQPGVLGSLMLLLSVAVAGLPPLSGFIGKLMLLQAAQGPAAGWVWGGVLATGLLSLLALARAGTVVFWKAAPPTAGPPAPAAPASSLLAVGLLAAGLVGLSVAAEPVRRYTDAAVAQLADRQGLARAVFGDGPGARPDAVRPFRLGDQEARP